MGALASLDQREEVRRSLKALLDARHASSSATPTTSTSSTPTPSAARSCRRSCCAADDAERAEPHEVEAFGPVVTLLAYATRRAGRRAGRPRPGQPGRLGRHRRRRLRPRRRARRRAVARPAAGARPGRRRGVDRARFAAAGARPRRPGPGRRRRGDGRHPRRAAPHAAHRRAGQPATMLTAVTGRWVAGAPRVEGDAPVPQVAGGAAGRRHAWSPARAPSRSRTSSTSPSSPATPSTPTPTRRPRAANPLFGGSVAHGYLVVSFAAGLFVEPGPGPGAGQLRRGQPALPHPGQARRRADRDADRQADHPARRAPTTARCAGTPTSPTRTASRWRSTTC